VAPSRTGTILAANLGVVAFFVLLSLAAGEWYPLSPFPMYSNFSNKVLYVYVTDTAGNPIPVETRFGVQTSELKKAYEGRLKKIKAETGISMSKMPLERRQESARETLLQLKESLAPEKMRETLRDERLQFHEVIVRLRKGGGLDEEKRMLAEF